MSELMLEKTKDNLRIAHLTKGSTSMDTRRSGAIEKENLTEEILQMRREIEKLRQIKFDEMNNVDNKEGESEREEP